MECVCGKELLWSNHSRSCSKEKQTFYLPREPEIITSFKKRTKAATLRYDDDYCHSAEDVQNHLESNPSDGDESAPLEAPATRPEYPETGGPSEPHDFASAIFSDATVVDISCRSEDEWCREFVMLEMKPRKDEDFSIVNVSNTSDSVSWEEISEVSSVKSWNSHTSGTKSFLEVARANRSDWKNVKPRAVSQIWPIHEHGTSSIAYSKEDRIAKDDEFDFHSLYQRAKGARGGKEKFMYNQEPYNRLSRGRRHRRS